jgi:hypothetical protein
MLGVTPYRDMPAHSKKNTKDQLLRRKRRASFSWQARLTVLALLDRLVEAQLLLLLVEPIARTQGQKTVSDQKHGGACAKGTGGKQEEWSLAARLRCCRVQWRNKNTKGKIGIIIIAKKKKSQ